MTLTSADPELHGEQNEPYADKWAAFTAIGISFFTAVMSMSMVFVVLSPMADDFGVTLRSVSWVVIVEALVVSAFMLPFGRLADMIGRKKVHMWGLVVFGSGAACVALAPTFALLLAARVVMALGSSMTQSVGTAMVVAVFPPAERGKAIGSQTTAVSIGGAMGPLVGGLLLHWLPWEALFALLIIPTAIAFVAGAVLLDEERVSGGPVKGLGSTPFDWIGAVLSGVLIVVVVLTINNPLAKPWTSPLIVSGAAMAIVLAIAFGRWELRRDEPMVQLRLFTNRPFTMAVAARLFGFIGSTATRFLLPIYLISLRGLSEGATGIVLFMISLGMGISAQSAGRLSDVFGTRPFAIVGFGGLVFTAAAFSFMDQTTPMWLVGTVVFASGLSTGLWVVPNSSTIFGLVPTASLGVIGALTNLTRNFGNVFGQAISAAVVVGVMVSRGFDIALSEIAGTAGAGDAFLTGWSTAYWLVVIFATLGLALSIAVKPRQTDSVET